MQQKILDFRVEDQHIRAPHYRVVGDSRNYLIARFSFGENWRELTKTAVFQGADGKAYHMLLENDRCVIPAEVLRPTRFTVSVFGGDRLTTDRATVAVDGSGMVAGISPPTPTPDIYDQLLSAVETERQLAGAAAITAAEKADAAETAALAAQAATETAKSAANSAAADAAESKNNKETALSYADEAAFSAEKADTAAKQAQEDAERITAQIENADAAATSAQQSADNAAAASITAAEKADAAETAALAAQTATETAKSAAMSAAADAAESKNNKETALSYADEAASSAEKADTAAKQAQEDAEKITAQIENADAAATSAQQSADSAVAAEDHITEMLKGFSMIGDVTLTEDVVTVRFTQDGDGNPISDYKDFFLYFAGKFKNDLTGGQLTVASDSSYWRFAYQTYDQSSTTEQTFWCWVEEVATVTDRVIRRSLYPADLLTQGGVAMNASGASTNIPAISNLTIRSASRKLVDFYITVNGVNTIVSGSRVVLLGRKKL